MHQHHPISSFYTSSFGSTMASRGFSSGVKYRYGFNTQEIDDEIAKGHCTADYWQYDSRLGIRFNLDPVVKEYESPYAILGNNPIWLVDINGNDTSFADKINRI